MRNLSSTCAVCGKEADYCDSVPDALLDGTHPSECGYSWKSFCWLHAAERRQVATSRVRDLLVVGGVAYLDRGYAGGACVCDECGRTYFDHQRLTGATFMTRLCDGSVVKL